MGSKIAVSEFGVEPICAHSLLDVEAVAVVAIWSIDFVVNHSSLEPWTVVVVKIAATDPRGVVIE